MKIPPNATRVFTGVRFDVYQWSQKMYDGSTATFELTSRKPCVSIIATTGDKLIVLLQEQPHKSPFYASPGGQIDDGETPEVAARRELLEETGCVPESLELIASYDGGSGSHFPEYLFLARNCKKIQELLLDGGEKIDPREVTFDDYLQLARQRSFALPLDFKFMIYDALLDSVKRKEIQTMIFGP